MTKEGAPSKGRRWVRALLALGGVALLTLQGAHGRSVKKAGLAEVGYAGCVEVLRTGPVCQFWWKGERRLRLHPPREAQDVQVRIDGKSTPASETRLKEGILLAVEIPLRASRVEVRWHAQREDWQWSLALEDRKPYSSWAREAQRSSSMPDGSSRALGILEASLPKASLREQAFAHHLRARLLCNGSAKGASLCFDAFAASVEAQRRADQLQGEIREVAALAYFLIQAHRFGQARRVLADLETPPGLPAEALWRIVEYRGLLERELRNHRSALSHFERASVLAEQLDPAGAFWRNNQELLGQELIELGRFEEAGAIFLRPLQGADSQSKIDSCEKAHHLTNQGWLLYLAIEAGSPLGDPVPPFKMADEIHSSTECPGWQVGRMNSSINLALAYLQRDPPDVSEAGKALALAEALQAEATAEERLWLFHLRGKLALARGRPLEALDDFDRFGSLAQALLSGEDRWRAAYGQALACEQLGRLDEAISTLGAADRFLDHQLASIPLDAGRESFADRWGAGARLLVDLLLRLHRSSEALGAARQARVRTLQQLATAVRIESLGPKERRRREIQLAGYWSLREDLSQQASADWKLEPSQLRKVGEERWSSFAASLKQLDRALAEGEDRTWRAPWRAPERKSGELTLAYFPLAENGQWVAFADDGSAVAAQRFQLPPAAADDTAARERLSQLLLEPFRQQILRAERVRILPYGALRRVPFHALPFAGDILLAAKPVAYGLDVAVPPSPSPGGRSRALIVADPQSNLPHARREGEEIAASLRGAEARWRIDTLSGGEEASKEAVVESLRSGLDLLHYAGHADFAGIGGWGSHLPLARGTSLTSGDLLALGLAPRWVVLSGCESGKTDPSVQLETLSLAHAFLLAGSQGVVAATDDVLDTASRQLMRELYRPVHGRSLDLTVLLRKAQLAMRARDPKGHWESFQVFVP